MARFRRGQDSPAAAFRSGWVEACGKNHRTRSGVVGRVVGAPVLVYSVFIRVQSPELASVAGRVE